MKKKKNSHCKTNAKEQIKLITQIVTLSCWC